MTLIMTVLLLGATLILRLCPETPLALFLRDQLVVRPLAWFANLRRHDIIYYIIVAGLLLSAGEMVAMLGSADLVLAFAADLALYFDIVAIGMIVALGSRLKVALQFIAARFESAVRILKRTPGKRRRRERRSCKRACNDDDECDSSSIRFAA